MAALQQANFSIDSFPVEDPSHFLDERFEDGAKAGGTAKEKKSSGSQFSPSLEGFMRRLEVGKKTVPPDREMMLPPPRLDG